MSVCLCVHGGYRGDGVGRGGAGWGRAETGQGEVGWGGAGWVGWGGARQGRVGWLGGGAMQVLHANVQRHDNMSTDPTQT